jgi:hypothetical protein
MHSGCDIAKEKVFGWIFIVVQPSKLPDHVLEIIISRVKNASQVTIETTYKTVKLVVHVNDTMEAPLVIPGVSLRVGHIEMYKALLRDINEAIC